MIELPLIQSLARDRPEARELNDWTRKGPLPDLPQNQRRPSERGGFGRNFDTASDAGSERGERRRGPMFEGDGKVRDLGNWERKGPLAPAASTGPPREGGRTRNFEGPREPRESREPPERKLSPSWGEGRSQDGSRPPRGEFRERPQYERQPTAAEMDNQWRSKMRPDAPAKSPVPTPNTSTPSSPAAANPPSVRPRLNLAKRTVSEAEPATSTSSSDSKASPFGAARPIDTAAREREVEEKRQLALRQKKEQEDKAREEKRAKEAAAKSEKSPASPQENGKASSNQGEPKENGADAPPATKNYEILRRANDEADMDEEGADEPTDGVIAEDQAVKPKEIVRDPPKQNEGSWRKEASAESTTKSLEEEGWSTVPAKPKNNKRGGNQGARALAS